MEKVNMIPLTPYPLKGAEILLTPYHLKGAEILLTPYPLKGGVDVDFVIFFLKSGPPFRGVGGQQSQKSVFL